MKSQAQDILDGDAAELDLLVSQMKDLMVGCKHFIYLSLSIHN